MSDLNEEIKIKTRVELSKLNQQREVKKQLEIAYDVHKMVQVRWWCLLLIHIGQAEDMPVQEI